MLDKCLGSFRLAATERSTAMEKRRKTKHETTQEKKRLKTTKARRGHVLQNRGGEPRRCLARREGPTAAAVTRRIPGQSGAQKIFFQQALYIASRKQKERHHSGRWQVLQRHRAPKACVHTLKFVQGPVPPAETGQSTPDVGRVHCGRSTTIRQQALKGNSPRKTKASNL